MKELKHHIRLFESNQKNLKIKLYKLDLRFWKALESLNVQLQRDFSKTRFSRCMFYRHNAAMVQIKTWFFGIIHCTSLSTIYPTQWIHWAEGHPKNKCMNEKSEINFTLYNTGLFSITNITKIIVQLKLCFTCSKIWVDIEVMYALPEISGTIPVRPSAILDCIIKEHICLFIYFNAGADQEKMLEGSRFPDSLSKILKPSSCFWNPLGMLFLAGNGEVATTLETG